MRKRESRAGIFCPTEARGERHASDSYRIDFQMIICIRTRGFWRLRCHWDLLSSLQKELITRGNGVVSESRLEFVQLSLGMGVSLSLVEKP
jgi:hypothetical protein